MGEYAPTVAIVFAGLIFAYLAMDELLSWKCTAVGSSSAAAAASSGESNNSSGSTLTMKTDGNNRTIDTIRIAIPMTLDNLAGGAAGGAAGIDAKIAGIMALSAF